MSEHDLEKLLGGFAADTLTREERQKLFTAALQDQQLFNALADEQALKELLADPAVRRKLLSSLEQKHTSGAGRPISWLDWFRRPAGLAFAGGLTAAALTVLLGVRIYQDSLKQAAQSVVTEEETPAAAPAPIHPTSQPATPHVTEPLAKAKENTEPLAAPAKKGALPDKMAERERAEPPSSQELRASDIARDNLKQENEQDRVRRQAEAPVAALNKTVEETIVSADQKLATTAAPPPAPMQTPANVPIAGAVGFGPSARALFFKTITEPTAELERRSQIAAAEEKPGDGSIADSSVKEKKRAERNLGLSAKLQTARQPIERPLGIRYSLIMAGPGGIDLEVDPATPVGKDDAPRLAIQTNEDGYLSVFYVRPSQDKPTVLFPSSGDGRLAGRKPVAIAIGNVFEVAQTVEQIRLLILFSRTPHDPNSPRPTGKNAPHLLTEQIDPSQPGAPAEQAVYVVNLDPAPAAALTVEIPLSLRP